MGGRGRGRGRGRGGGKRKRKRRGRGKRKRKRKRRGRGEEEEELEVEEFTHKGIQYYLVGSKDDGQVYSIDADEDLGDLQGSYRVFMSH